MKKINNKIQTIDEVLLEFSDEKYCIDKINDCDITNWKPHRGVDGSVTIDLITPYDLSPLNKYLKPEELCNVYVISTNEAGKKLMRTEQSMRIEAINESTRESNNFSSNITLVRVM